MPDRTAEQKAKGLYKTNVVNFRLPDAFAGPVGVLMKRCMDEGYTRKPDRTKAVLVCIAYALLAQRRGVKLTDMIPQMVNPKFYELLNPPAKQNSEQATQNG